MINRKKIQRLYLARKGFQSDGDAAAGVLWARRHPLRFWRCRTSAEASTSFMTR